MSKYFHLAAASGLITTSGADGVLFSMRVPSASLNKIYVQRVKAAFLITTPPTAAQEITLAMNLATFVDNFTTGNGAADANVSHRSIDVQRVLASSQIPTSCLTTGDARIAGTQAMTAGATPPTPGNLWARTGRTVPATASLAAQQIDPIVLEWVNPMMHKDFEAPLYGCLPLAANGGFLIRTPVAFGAATVGRLVVEVDFFE